MLPAPLSRAVATVISVVWNRAARRPRLPLRLVLTAVVAALLSGIAALGVGLIAGGGSGGPLPGIDSGPVLQVAGAVLAAVGVTAVVAIAGVAIDRRRLADFGLHLDRDWWLDCAFGAALGLALITGVFLVGVGAAWFRVTGLVVTAAGASAVGLAAGYLVLFAAVSVAEELAVRGYLLTNLAEGLRVGPVGGSAYETSRSTAPVRPDRPPSAPLSASSSATSSPSTSDAGTFWVTNSKRRRRWNDRPQRAERTNVMGRCATSSHHPSWP